METNLIDVSNQSPSGLAKIAGRTGYFIRELINEFRGKFLQIADAVNDGCFTLIDRLDRNPHVAYFRRLDRGQ